MSEVQTLRVSEVERAGWRAAASRQGLSLAVWMRRALGRVAEVELALARQERAASAGSEWEVRDG